MNNIEKIALINKKITLKNKNINKIKMVKDKRSNPVFNFIFFTLIVVDIFISQSIVSHILETQKVNNILFTYFSFYIIVFLMSFIICIINYNNINLLISWISKKLIKKYNNLDDLLSIKTKELRLLHSELDLDITQITNFDLIKNKPMLLNMDENISKKIINNVNVCPFDSVDSFISQYIEEFEDSKDEKILRQLILLQDSINEEFHDTKIKLAFSKIKNQEMENE